jgi:hypothetical protein
VTDLDAALRDLAAHVAFPEPPDVATAVRLRLAGAPAPAAAPTPLDRWRRPGARRLLAVAAVVVLVIVAVTAAVPRARHAVADRLGLRGVEVRIVPTLPSMPTTAVPPTTAPGATGAGATAPGPTGAGATAPPATDLPGGVRLGRRTTLAEAAAATVAPSPFLVPPEAPTAVFVDDRTGEVNLLFGDGLLLGQFPNSRPFFEKLIGSGDETVAVTVDGGRGLWLPGETHVLVELGEHDATETRPRLAGPTLLWEHGDTTLRLEGAPSLEAALAIATSLRPYG